ncbi:hypothetical protein BC835DRAFT_60504 [Cytidiella melzeri]|nr:hypothetical protein BC835DRAFT_60504 [Cytidiella melzeri]
MARGKFNQKRGGGRSFSKHLVLNEEGTAVSVDKWGKKKEEEEEDSDEEESEEESEEEESEEEVVAGTSQAQQSELSRAERKQMKKDKKAQDAQKAEGSDEDEDQDPLFANPNIAAGKKMDLSSLSAPRTLSRREKDEKAAKEAKEKYWKQERQIRPRQTWLALLRSALIARQQLLNVKQRQMLKPQRSKLRERKPQRRGKRNGMYRCSWYHTLQRGLLV